MILKWGIGGAIAGAIFGIFTRSNILGCAVFGAILGVSIRKWILRKLWM